MVPTEITEFVQKGMMAHFSLVADLRNHTRRRQASGCRIPRRDWWISGTRCVTPRVFTAAKAVANHDQYLTANSTGKSLRSNARHQARQRTIEDVSRESCRHQRQGSGLYSSVQPKTSAAIQPSQRMHLVSQRKPATFSEGDSPLKKTKPSSTCTGILNERTRKAKEALADVLLGAKDWKEGLQVSMKTPSHGQTQRNDV